MLPFPDAPRATTQTAKNLANIFPHAARLRFPRARALFIRTEIVQTENINFSRAAISRFLTPNFRAFAIQKKNAVAKNAFFVARNSTAKITGARRAKSPIAILVLCVQLLFHASSQPTFAKTIFAAPETSNSATKIPAPSQVSSTRSAATSPSATPRAIPLNALSPLSNPIAKANSTTPNQTVKANSDSVKTPSVAAVSAGTSTPKTANDARPNGATSNDAKSDAAAEKHAAAKKAASENATAQNAISSDAEKNSVSRLELAPAIVQNLRRDGVWVEPSLRASVDSAAISRTLRAADFPVRVLVLRRLPSQFRSISDVARAIHALLGVSDQRFARDDLTLVCTRDDAHLGLFGADLNARELGEIAMSGAQTWTQEGEAGGVAQTLRLVSAERNARNRAYFLRMSAIFGSTFLVLGGALWLRLSRNRKRSVWRALSQSIVVPTALSEEIAAPNTNAKNEIETENPKSSGALEV